MSIDKENVREVVKEKYGKAALTVLQGKGHANCCSGGDCGQADPISVGLYDAEATAGLPQEAVLASLGCGNPTALARLQPGETVLDLGSGGGIDVLLSAKRVGPTGFAYGLDMTDEMLELANANKAKSGVQNVEFLKGHIEEIPLPDNSVDVIISNCVINLSGDKPKVINEAFRVLKPGGRFAVSDIVLEAALPDAVLKDMLAYVGCVAGALQKTEYQRLLEEAGFENIGFEVTQKYTFADLESSTFVAEMVSKISPEERAGLDGKVVSAFIRAQKPVAKTGCCG